MRYITAPVLRSARARTPRRNPGRAPPMDAMVWRRRPGQVLGALSGAGWNVFEERREPTPLRVLWDRVDNEWRDILAMFELAIAAGLHPARIVQALYAVALLAWNELGKYGSQESSEAYGEAMVQLHNLLGGSVEWPTWELNDRGDRRAEAQRRKLIRALDFLTWTVENAGTVIPSVLAEACGEILSVAADAGVSPRKLARTVREQIPWGVMAVQLKARGEDLGEPLWASVIAPYVPRLRTKSDQAWVWQHLSEYGPQIEAIAKEMAATGRWEDGALTPFVAAAQR